MPIPDDRLRSLVADVVRCQIELESDVTRHIRHLGAAVERLDEAISERGQSLRGRLLEEPDEGGDL